MYSDKVNMSGRVHVAGASGRDVFTRPSFPSVMGFIRLFIPLGVVRVAIKQEAG